MTDNISVTSGSGAVIAANMVTYGGSTSALMQAVKLFDATSGSVNAASVSSAGGLAIVAQGNVPAAGSNSAIATGGVSVTLVTGPCSGGYITNPPNLASQGIATAENAYVNPVTAPGSTDGAANGTTTLLAPGQSYTIPALAAGQFVRGNAATSGHKLTVVVFP